MKPSRVLLLAGMLLVAQFALLAHHTDVDAHAAGGVCQICLHTSSLDAGLVAGPLAVAALQAFLPFFFAPSTDPATVIARPFDARGPPPFFSA